MLLIVLGLDIFNCTSGRLFFFQALDLTVQLMETGEKALIHTDAKYAYGTQGR